MDRGAWWATASGVAKSDMTEQLTLSLFFTFAGKSIDDISLQKLRTDKNKQILPKEDV